MTDTVLVEEVDAGCEAILTTMPTERMSHQPVMVREVVEFLAPRPGMVVVDCTVGTGGHSLAVLPHLLPDGRLIAVDRDAHALERAKQTLREFDPQTRFLHEDFRHLRDLLTRGGIARLDGLIADLGMSSLQVDDAARGFSFLKEGPLDMRMDQRESRTAADLVRRLSEAELAHVIQTYGEERWARRIAKRLVAVRRKTPIDTTTHLARIVAEAVPRQASRRLHPATRTFQALRIAVNQELAALEELLRALPEVLGPGGRAVIITFHSLEDRLVKQAFRAQAQEDLVHVLTKKPVRPSAHETAENPRSRSAKLRVVERRG